MPVTSSSQMELYWKLEITTWAQERFQKSLSLPSAKNATITKWKTLLRSEQSKIFKSFYFAVIYSFLGIVVLQFFLSI